jgi:putative acetyltransferase|nr:N-acetyltransferase [uncultured Aquabacterium sp.]
MKPITLRDETPADVGAIHDITVAAFAPLELSGHTEQFVVQALRAAHALPVSLVAEVDGQPVGHIAFSPVTLSDGTPDWYGMGPVSVLPAHQRQGIGKALIHEGLARLKALHARGCCLVGHPGYYRRFGFENAPDLSLDGVPPDVLFALSFEGRLPRGTVTFHPAFMATGPASEISEDGRTAA